MIFSGSPSGISPIKIGDTYKGYIREDCLFTCKIESDGKRKLDKPSQGNSEQQEETKINDIKDIKDLKENYSKLDSNLFS